MVRHAFPACLVPCLALSGPVAADPCPGWLDRAFWADAGPEAVEACDGIGTPDAASTDAGETALHLAVASANTSVIRRLLSAGADPNRTRRDGRTALHVAAAEATDPDAIVALVFWGAEVDARFDAVDGWNPLEAPGTLPLHLAAGRADGHAIAAALIAAGTDLAAEDAAGRTPLHRAAAADPDGRLVGLLLVAGADPNVADGEGWTPLHVAADRDESPSPGVVWSLLAKGADPDDENDNGVLPLHRAAANSTSPAVFLLLAKTTEGACEPFEMGETAGTAIDLADGNAALEGTPEYWWLHDRCARQAE